jgi:PhnB protein
LVFVPNVDKIVANAVAASAIGTNPANDYEYGYRQASIRDSFGHHWQIQ